MKRFSKIVAILAMCFGLLAASSNADVSNRDKKQIGLWVGIMDPFPSLLGIGIAYNAFDLMKFRAGYAKFGTSSASIQTIGGSADFFIPGWSFSPYAGIGASYFTLSVLSYSASIVVPYVSFGLDWQFPILPFMHLDIYLGYKVGFVKAGSYSKSYSLGVGAYF